MLTVVNVSCNQLLATPVKPAFHFWARLQGSFGLAWGRPWQGLYLKPCQAIHTLGMRRALDVVFVDQDGMVLKWATVKPWRFYWGGRRASAALELKAGTCAAKRLSIGDRLLFREQTKRFAESIPGKEPHD